MVEVDDADQRLEGRTRGRHDMVGGSQTAGGSENRRRHDLSSSRWTPSYLPRHVCNGCVGCEILKRAPRCTSSASMYGETCSHLVPEALERGRVEVVARASSINASRLHGSPFASAALTNTPSLRPTQRNSDRSTYCVKLCASVGYNHRNGSPRRPTASR